MSQGAQGSLTYSNHLLASNHPLLLLLRFSEVISSQPATIFTSTGLETLRTCRDQHAPNRLAPGWVVENVKNTLSVLYFLSLCKSWESLKTHTQFIQNWFLVQVSSMLLWEAMRWKVIKLPRWSNKILAVGRERESRSWEMRRIKNSHPWENEPPTNSPLQRKH